MSSGALCMRKGLFLHGPSFVGHGLSAYVGYIPWVHIHTICTFHLVPDQVAVKHLLIEMHINCPVVLFSLSVLGPWITPPV